MIDLASAASSSPLAPPSPAEPGAPPRDPDALDQDDYAGNAGDVLKHALWGLVAEAASFLPGPVGFVETHCGLVERTVRLDARRAHLAAPMPTGDGTGALYYAEVLHDRLRVEGTFARVPGSLALTLHAMRDRAWRGRTTFGIFMDRDPGVVASVVEGVRAIAEPRPCAIRIGDAFDAESLGDLGARVAELCPGPAPRALFALVDPFRYAPRGAAGPLEAHPDTLRAEAFHRFALELLAASQEPKDVLVAAWIYDHGDDAAAELRRALCTHDPGAVVSLSRIEAPGHDHRRYAMIVGGAGAEGARIARLTLADPFRGSPLLEALGFRVVTEER